MFVREIDIEAYRRVQLLEKLLRRVVRWELRGRYGSSWFNSLGNLAATIDDRMQSERRNGSFDRRSSELSYLDLRELIAVIFEHRWADVFSTVFGGKRFLKGDLIRTLVCTRNKVAHFRGVTPGDMEQLVAEELLLPLFSRYYGDSARTAQHLSGDPEKAAEQIAPKEERLIVRALESCGHSQAWDEYVRLESMRAYGLSPGIGVYHHHLFFEIFTGGSFRPQGVLAWLDSSLLDVTFLNVGQAANYLRVFVPIKSEPRAVRRVMRGLAAAAREGAQDDLCSASLARDGYDLGFCEGLNGEGTGAMLGFAF